MHFFVLFVELKLGAWVVCRDGLYARKYGMFF